MGDDTRDPMSSNLNESSAPSTPDAASSFDVATNGSSSSTTTLEFPETEKERSDNYTNTILGLLYHAAQNAPGNGSMFLENGIRSTPRFQSYSELYETAKVVTPAYSHLCAKGLIKDQVNARFMQRTGLFRSSDVILIYFDTPRLNVEWFWSVMVFGGIPAICNPLSNNQVTLKAHLSHLNSLLKQPKVITAQRLVECFNPVPELQVTSAEYITSTDPPIDVVWPAEHDNVINEPAVLLFTSGSSGQQILEL